MQSKRSSNMFHHRKPFKRSLLALAIMTTGSAVYAQENESADEEVVVTGIRANLADAAEIKRQSSTHIDVISAKDIGSLPDASSLEAIQRVPGVAIERFNAADDPDHFSVEGSGLTLRGLPQTRSEFNGRDAFSASSGRGLTFQDVPPELLGSVEVIKNHTADMIEGGISGTVNLTTRKPLDTDKDTAIFTYTRNHSDHRHDSLGTSTPAFSTLLSSNWDVGDGKFGALLSYSNTELEFRTDGFEAGLWEDRPVQLGDQTVNRWVPRSAGVRTTDIDRSREAGSFVLQYENGDGSFDATLEYFKSTSTVDWRETAFYLDENAFLPDGGVFVPNSDAEFNDIHFVRGTLTGTSDTRTQSRRQQDESNVEDFSLNLNWRATENLTLSVDYQHIDADTEVTDLSVFGAARADAYLDVSGDLADVQYTAPGVSRDDIEANRDYFTDPSNYFHLAAMDHLEDSDGSSDAIRLDALYDFDNDFIDSVQAGVRFAEREQTTRWSKFNWAVLSEHWAGPDNRRVFFDGRAEPAPWTSDPDEFLTNIPAPHFEEPGSFFRGRSDSGIVGGAWLAPSQEIVRNYDSYLSLTGQFPNPLASLGTRTTDASGNPVELINDYYLPTEVNPLKEENTAFYIRVNFSDSSDKLVGNFGLRYVKQDQSTSGGISYRLPSQVSRAVVEQNNDLSAFGYTDEQIASFNLITTEDLDFLSGGIELGERDKSFSKILPSLNLRYEFKDDMYVRFAASRSVAFPETGLLRFSTFVEAKEVDIIREDPNDTDGVTAPVAYSFERLGGESGNPFLKPMESTNIDLSWEWYLSEGNTIAAGVFHKDIKNFFATSARDLNLQSNGVSRTVNVLSPVNSGDGKLSGFEFAFSHFWGNGFGMQFNYTNLQEDSIPNQNTRAVEVDFDGNTAPPFENLPLQGLSEHTYNVAGIYEKHGIRARLAYNYRSEYLLTQSQVNLDRPIYSQAIGILDGSIFYTVNDHVELGLTVNNILDDVTKTDVQLTEEGLTLPRSYFLNDRRFALVFKLSL